MNAFATWQQNEAEGTWVHILVELSSLMAPAPGCYLWMVCLQSMRTYKMCCSRGDIIRSPGGLLDFSEKPLSHLWRCLGVRAPLPFNFQSLPVRMLRAVWALPKVLNFRKQYIFCFSLSRSLGRNTASRPGKWLHS